MKKYGKKWRKLQKEKEIRKKNMKIGEPYSRARTKIHICKHYSETIYPNQIIRGGMVFALTFYHSKLSPISDSECMCGECRKLFPINKMDQMEKLVNELFIRKTDDAYISKLSSELEPVYYRRLSETDIEILETVTDGIIMPRHTCIL